MRWFKNKKKKDLNVNFIKEIYKKDRLVRYAQFLLGLVVIAAAFNLFSLPSGVVYGVSGIGVMFNKLYGIDPSTVILISSIILLVVSYFALGRESTARTVVGSLLYPVFVKLTEWMPQYLEFVDVEPLVIVLFGAVLTGLGLGLIFKSGFIE